MEIIDTVNVEDLTDELTRVAVSMATRLECLDAEPSSITMDGFEEQVKRLTELLYTAWEFFRGGIRPIEVYEESNGPNRSLFNAYVFGYFVHIKLPEEYKQPRLSAQHRMMACGASASA